MAVGQQGTGFRNQKLPLLFVANSIINKHGMFFYSGSPALGNLIESVGVAVAGTDPFGNVYFAGDNAYSPSGNSVGLNAAAINFNLAGAVFGGAAVMTAPLGGPSGVPGLLITSPSDVNSVTNDSQSAIGFAGRSADGTKGPFIWLGSNQFGSANVQSIPILAVGGQLSYAAPGVPGGGLVQEKIHTIAPTAAGWTGSISYELQPQSGKVFVQVIANVANGTNVAFATTIVTLPAGYIPSNFKSFSCSYFDGATVNVRPFDVGTAGQVRYTGPAFVAGATAQFTGQFEFTLTA
jgi:hypothetical protein